MWKFKGGREHFLYLQLPELGVRDIIKKGNKEAKGEEMKRLFGN